MISDQLNLRLEDPRVRIPWGGISPRDLTRSRLALFSRQEPQKDDRFFVDPDQYDLFLAAITGRHRYGGAPSLLPLPGGEHG